MKIPENHYTIAVYYFPNFHHDPRNELVHGKGWTEWELLKSARPRFEKHNQPIVPLWGYEDESDPSVMSKKISTAIDHNIDVFIFDWYWYNDGPYLQRALENGFLKTHDNRRLRFAIHWANHDWLDIHPAKLYEIKNHSSKILYPGEITPKTFEKMTNYVINNYFSHPLYWKIDEKPYFSIYDLPSLIRSFGSLDSTAKALDEFRNKVAAAGFSGLHLNQVLWNTGILSSDERVNDPVKILNFLGFDSFTSYVWIHHVPLSTYPTMDYVDAANLYLNYFENIAPQINLPYFPNLTMGWDSSPRTLQSDIYENVGYPFTPVLSNNSPQNFYNALLEIKKRMDTSATPKILTINAWNEWTEGSYLEPDTINKFEFLEAIKQAFTIS